jgi:pimeloyl-ACP methyl ester carboxylesterase
MCAKERHVPRLPVNGLAIYYERNGDGGDPIVFAHGYTGDTTDWTAQADAFAPTHRVLVMDHRGHGKSQLPAERAQFTIEAMADDVEALAEHAGFDRYHLVGHSMGGAIAQEIALRRPERLLSLTLEDTGYLFGATKDDPLRGVMAGLYAVAESQGMGAIAAMAAKMERPPHMPPDRAERDRERITRLPVDTFVGAGRAMEAWQGTRERAHQITTPTLVVCGELDAGVMPGATWLAENIPGAAWVEIPKAHHSPQIERPDLFQAALRDHVERHGSGQSR